MTHPIIYGQPAASYQIATCLIIQAIVAGQPDQDLVEWQNARNRSFPHDHKHSYAGTPAQQANARSLQ